MPPGLERIVKRCLEKDPEHRFRSAHDLAFALEALSGSGPGTEPAAALLRLRRRWLLAGAALVAAAAAGLLVFMATRSRQRSPDLPPPRVVPLTSMRGSRGVARRSPRTASRWRSTGKGRSWTTGTSTSRWSAPPRSAVSRRTPRWSPARAGPPMGDRSPSCAADSRVPRSTPAASPPSTWCRPWAGPPGSSAISRLRTWARPRGRPTADGWPRRAPSRRRTPSSRACTSSPCKAGSLAASPFRRWPRRVTLGFSALTTPSSLRTGATWRTRPAPSSAPAASMSLGWVRTTRRQDRPTV